MSSTLPERTQGAPPLCGCLRSRLWSRIIPPSGHYGWPHKLHPRYSQVQTHSYQETYRTSAGITGSYFGSKTEYIATKELDLDLGPSTFWIDSTIVLQYINNTEARYHTYVANWVAEIQDTTDAKEWRHVPTQENPADDASRGVPASSLSESRWLHGPDFLQLPSERWPSAPTLRPISEHDPEVKKAVTFTT